MEKENLTKDAKYKAFMLYWAYWQALEKKHQEDLKKCVEAMQKDIEKQEKLHQDLVMMRDHPEWFETTSPKEFGIKKLGKRKR